MRHSRPILSIVFLALATTAHAATPNEASALKRFEDGKKAFDAGQFEPALAAFQDSLQLLPSPNTRFYIGRCFKALGKPASAFTAFRLATREASDRLNATNEKRFKATRDAAAAEAAEIEAKVPRLTVAVPSDAPSALVVKLDGADLPKAAWGAALETDPGKHRVTAEGPRRSPFDTTFDLKEGQQLRIEVNIARLPTGVLKLVLQSRPSGLEILVDGTPADPATWEVPLELDAGSHRVVARAPGYVDFTWDKPIADGDRAEVPVSLEAQKLVASGGVGTGAGTPKWVFFAVAGLSVVALGGGTYFAVDAKAKSNDEKAKDPLLRLPPDQDKIRSLSTQANVLFIAGAALAVGAGVLAFTTKWQSTESAPTTARVSPWVGPTGGGVAAAGSF